MSHLTSDLRYALRTLLRSRGFTIVSILTIALAIGANTAIFSFVDGVLLKPLPYRDPERLALLWEKPPGGTRNGVSALNFMDWRDQSTSFSHVVGISGAGFTITGSGEPQMVRGQTVSAPYFDLLGMQAAHGRTFRPEEEQVGKSSVVVLTNKIWAKQFGSDPKILGQTISLDGTAHTVIGVLPAGGVFDRDGSEIYVPLALDRAKVTRSFHFMRVLARLKDGVTLEQARREMDAIGARLAREYPDSNRDWGVTVDKYVDRVVNPQLRQSLLVLLAAVGAVLLIGCANTANLLLARGAAREREISVRSALGAGRGRIISQLLTESLVLASAGGVLGIALGYAMLRGIQAAMPPFMLPAQADVSLDWRVLAFTAGVSLLTGILFGIAPALGISRRNTALSLREGGRSSTGGLRTQKLRGALVITEVALSFLLVSGAGLLVRSFLRLQNTDAGFETTNVITIGLPMSMEKNTDGSKVTAYVERMLEQVQSLPGVRQAAVTSALPLQGWGFGMPFQIADQPVTDKAKRQACFFKIVSPAYFQAIGMRLKRGRVLSASDVKSGAPVTVINEEMAKRFFKDQNPLGKRILIEQILTGKRELGPDIPWEVVGIVANEKVGGLDDTSAGVYVPFAQSPVVGISLLVRGIGDPSNLVKGIQAEVWGVNKDQALTNVRTLETIKSESLGSNRLRTILLAVFAGLALLLAAVGIYGVISYSVAQRTAEMGIRAALGATAMDQLRLVMGSGLVLAGIGLTLGVAGAFGLTRLLASLLFETSPTELTTMTIAGGTLLAVALLACYVPARRATKVDPMVALRYE